MKWLVLSMALLIFPTSTALAQQQDKFAACAGKTGKDYQQARDHYLAASPTDAFLQEKLKSTSWRDRLAARILMGWTKNEADYRRLLSSPKEMDQAGASYYVWAVSRDGIKGKDVPLMYELLTKDVDPDAARDAARALLALAQKQPVALDMYTLHEYLRDKEGGSKSGRAAVAWLISALPAKYQVAQELQTSLKSELARADQSRDIVLFLLTGLGHAADKATAGEKDQWTQALLDMDRLDTVVGKSSLTYAIGKIGGDKASEQVAAYLKNAADPVEKLWALRTLAKCDSNVATDVLLAYADNAEPMLRTQAIEGLGRAHYQPKVLEKLMAIAQDKKTSDAQRVLIGQSLAMISSTHPKNADLQKQIQNSIQTISNATTSSEIRQELKAIYKSLSPQSRP
jgi:hypothetical protein